MKDLINIARSLGILRLPTADSALGGLMKTIDKLDDAAVLQAVESSRQAEAVLIAKAASDVAASEADKAGMRAAKLRDLVGV